MYDTSHRYQSQLQVLPAQTLSSANPARFPTIASLLSTTTPIPTITTPKLGPVSASTSTSLMNLNRSASPATSAEMGDNDNSLSPQSHHHGIATRDSPPDGASGKARALSTSKRAEQNRRAQRAFRERRDARVKHLEARAALLEETIGQADEANRRWEECRALVDRLRHENAMLRTALEQAGISVNGIPSSHSNSHSQSHGQSSSSSTNHNNHTHGTNGIDPSNFSTRPITSTSSTGEQMNGVELHPTLQDATLINGTGDGHNKKRKRRDIEDDLRQ